MYEHVKTIFITCIISLIVGVIGTSAGFVIVGNADNRRLNSELGASRADFESLEREYRAIERSNLDLGKRLDSVASGIAEAKRLAGQLSVQGESAASTIRRVIENLRKIKIILEGIGDVKLRTGWAGAFRTGLYNYSGSY